MPPPRTFRQRLGTLRARLVRSVFGVSRTDIAELSSDLAGLEEMLREQRAALARLAALLRAQGEEVLTLRNDATAHLGELDAALHGVTDGLEAVHASLGGLGDRFDAVDERLERSELHAAILPTTTWIAGAEVPASSTVTVILATRNRSEWLGRAIRSVLSQTYQRWELIVVDDASEDGTSEVLAVFGDPRIRSIRAGGRGVGPARNRGLDAARGDIVTYLDDDNLLHPDWLKTVVWAFERRPDADVVYGARVMDLPAGASPDGLAAALQLEPFDRRRLERDNYIDLGTIAHRAGLPEARFDESLTTQADWEMLLRLTRARPPVAMAAVAVIYTTRAPGRLTDHPSKLEDRDRIRMRVRETQPIRVLGYNQLFPLLCESYIEEELEALAAQGAEIAYCRRDTPIVDVRVPRPVYQDLDRAIREFGPHVLFLHWAEFAEMELQRLEGPGIPFGVRMHSFDFDRDLAARLLAHPLCVGLWAYPHHAEAIPGAYALPSMLTSVDRVPDPAPVRDGVVSVSSALPKKEWDLVIRALCALEGVDRRIIVARTAAFEDLPVTIAAKLAAACGDPPSLHVDVERDQVFALLARTAVLLYALEPGIPFGNPMSVVEGLCAGASIVLPDRPEALAFAGPHARGYRTAGDIVDHVREVLAGGPDIEAEHEDNRRYGLERFCDDLVAKRFYTELTEALARRQPAG